MGYRWKPSKTQARAFAQQMDDVRAYCDENGISYSASMDSYYFTVNGERYRVSNHTVAQSNRAAFDRTTGERLRDFYHGPDEYDREHEITASKTRLISIHKALLAGHKLDKRGNIKE